MSAKEQIKNEMKRQGVTAYALANTLDWHMQSIYRMLGDKHDMKLANAEAIADALGCELTLRPKGTRRKALSRAK